MRRTIGSLCIAAALALVFAPLLARAQTVSVKNISGDSALLIAKMPQCTTACPDSIRRVWFYREAYHSRIVAPKTTDTLRVVRSPLAQPAQLSYTPFKTTRKSVTVAARVATVPPVTPPVVVPPVTPPVIPPSTFTPNVPAGLTLVTDTRFNATAVGLTGGGTSGVNYWNWSAPSSICRAVGDTLEVTYPANSLGNGTGGCLIAGPEQRKWVEVYFAMSVFVPSSYSMHSNAEKWLYMFTASATDATPHATIIEWIPQGGETPSGPTFGLILMPSSVGGVMYPQPSGGPWYWISQTPGSPRVTKGAWHTIEASLVMNTPGAQNGAYRLWIDGALVMSGNNAVFRSGASQGYFAGIRYDGTRGGGASTTPTPASGQVRRYGRLAWYARGIN